jgi:hypothetical protein
MSQALPDTNDSRRLRIALACVTWLAIVINLCFAALLTWDLIRAGETPGQYPFGAENLGWKYRSVENYQNTSIVLVSILGTAAIATLLIRRHSLKIAIGYGTPMLLLWIGLLTAGG